MTTIDANSRIKPLVNKTFCWIAVRIFLRQLLYLKHRMISNKFLDRRRLVVAGVINKQYYFLQSVSFRISHKIGKMFPEFDVSSAGKTIKDYVFLWPEQSNETINAFGVAKRWYMNSFSFLYPTPLNFGEKVYPFLILKNYSYFFFKRAEETRLYRFISALFL